MFIKDIFKENKVCVSFEIFPPKATMPKDEVLNVAKELSLLNPSYISVTCGAGGSSEGEGIDTIDTASYIKNTLSTETLAHLTCVLNGREATAKSLERISACGIQNVLALRGDLPEGYKEPQGDFKHACDLVSYLKQNSGLCIGAACYPEGHIENPDTENDLDMLKYKVDCGVDFLVTQLFFDNNMLYSFLYKAARKNINVPVTAGIMPVMGRAQIQRMCRMSGATLTPKFRIMVDKFYSNPLALRQAGIAYATEQIIDLIANGVKNIHIYTMNKPDVAGKIISNLQGVLE